MPPGRSCAPSRRRPGGLGSEPSVVLALRPWTVRWGFHGGAKRRHGAVRALDRRVDDSAIATLPPMSPIQRSAFGLSRSAQASAVPLVLVYIDAPFSRIPTAKLI